MVAGRYAMRVRPRHIAWPPSTIAVQPLSDLLAQHPELTPYLLDFEISFGILESGFWTIEQSTLPVLRGARFAFAVHRLDDTQARIVSTAGVTDWQILEWTDV
jgi:hypothetical protein